MMNGEFLLWVYDWKILLKIMTDTLDLGAFLGFPMIEIWFDEALEYIMEL